MNNIFFALVLISVLFLLLGLIKPKLVIYWGSRKRTKVIFIYGLLLLLSFILFAVTLDEKELESNEQREEEVSIAPCVSITYDISCTGSNSTGVELFKASSPVKVNISYSGNLFRMLEEGGTSGYVLADFDKKEAYLLDTLNRTATKATYTDIEESMQDENMQKMMPYHYRPQLKETSETEIICGYNCRKYKVLKSGFVRAYAKADVWITDKLLLKPMRYDFQTDYKRILNPLPLQLGVDKGTVMKAVVDENDVIVTYKVTSSSTEMPDETLFVVPEDYRKITE